MTTPIVKETLIDAPASVIWSALTNKEEMKQWYFDIAEFEPVVGFKFQFEGGDKESNKIFVHLCEITEVQPNKKLAYTWRYEGYEGISLVTFELFEEDGKTRVKLTHTGLDTFPALPDFARENFAAGWNHIIGTSLKEYTEKKH